MQSGNDKQFCVAILKRDITICSFFFFMFISTSLFFCFSLSLYPFLTLFLSLPPVFSIFFSLSLSIVCLSLSLCNYFILCVHATLSPSPLSIFSLSHFDFFCNSLCLSRPLQLSILVSFPYFWLEFELLNIFMHCNR